MTHRATVTGVEATGQCQSLVGSAFQITLAQLDLDTHVLVGVDHFAALKVFTMLILRGCEEEKKLGPFCLHRPPKTQPTTSVQLT